jgi:hypothetical protein
VFTYPRIRNFADEPCLTDDEKCIHLRQTDRMSIDGVKFKTWDCYCEDDIYAGCIREMESMFDSIVYRGNKNFVTSKENEEGDER